MKLKYFSFSLLASSLLVWSASVNADYACVYDLQLGVVTGKQQIRILGASGSSRTLFQINDGKHIFREGRLLKLDPNQRAIVKEYADGIEHVVPEITLLAKEGVSIVTDNITRIYSGLVGRNAASTSELEASMKKVEYRVKEKFGQARAYYFINPGKLEMDESLEGSLQAQIETGFSNVSGILTALATLDVSEEDTESEYQLRKRARKTCYKLKKLNALEDKLHASVPELKRLDVVTKRARQTPTADY